MAKRIDYNNNRVNLSFFYFKFALFLKVLTKYFGFLGASLWFLTASLKLACEQAHLCEFGKNVFATEPPAPTFSPKSHK